MENCMETFFPKKAGLLVKIELGGIHQSFHTIPSWRKLSEPIVALAASLMEPARTFYISVFPKKKSIIIQH